MANQTLQEWLDAYGESHQNRTNKLIHFVCVPVIFLTVVGLLWAIPVPEVMAQVPGLNWATLGLLFVVIYYARLSFTLMLGMLVFSLLCVAIIRSVELAGLSVLWSSVVVFVLAWIGQFVGHKMEGKKPSFFEDLQFLMIGPAWIMNFLYRRLGLPV